MRILVAHNAYQHRGGEDAVATDEVALLRANGHDVIEYLRHNDQIESIGRIRLAAETLWSRRTHADFRALLGKAAPDIVHAHNTFPLISPSLYWAAADAGVPVVQTLHNFRLLCPQAMLLRDGRICEDCVGHMPWPAVVHGCYRGSRVQSGMLAGMLVLHRGLGTWDSKVRRYIALNEFCRTKFVQGGLPAARIAVKPNFVADPGIVEGIRQGLLFVGRLSAEKGVSVLAEAASTLGRGLLRVVGEGPDDGALRRCPEIAMLGALAPAKVQEQMAGAVALVLPSIWYENFPRTLVEAFAAGLPVIVSRIGALAELVKDGETGLFAEPGNSADLGSKMQWALQNPARMSEMGRAARRVYEQCYTPEINFQQLMAIYDEAIQAEAPAAGA